MANLNGANIGTNYKGILNLDSTINTPLDATLRALTDGMGTSSVLSLSTAAASLGSGTITSNGVLTIKGAGANILSLRDSSDVEKVSISNAGLATFASSVATSGNFNLYNNWATLSATANGKMVLFDNTGVSWSALQLGGTTSAFPAIKRNAAAIDFRLADDSAYCNISAGRLTLGSGAVVCGYINDPTNAVSAITIASSTGTTSFTPAAIALSAGATNPKQLSLAYTINNSGAQTGTATGIFLNATETALNGMAHNLMDLQVGGVSKFKVTNAGGLTSSGDVGSFTYSSYFNFVCSGGGLIAAGTNESQTAWTINGSSTWLLRLKANGVEKLTVNNVGTIAWGTTSSFPAIKRNGAAIDFRLADDSGYCDIRTGTNTILGLITFDTNGSGRGRAVGLEQIVGTSGAGGVRIVSTQDGSLVQATAQLQVDSTTKGFLPPRMTTTQKNAITTPAEGLIVMDITLHKLCMYNGSAWETITSL